MKNFEIIIFMAEQSEVLAQIWILAGNFCCNFRLCWRRRGHHGRRQALWAVADRSTVAFFTKSVTNFRRSAALPHKGRFQRGLRFPGIRLFTENVKEKFWTAPLKVLAKFGRDSNVFQFSCFRRGCPFCQTGGGRRQSHDAKKCWSEKLHSSNLRCEMLRFEATTQSLYCHISTGGGVLWYWQTRRSENKKNI